MEEKNVYILLTDTGTLLARAIRFFTKQPLNHASISFDPKLKTVYSFGRKRPRNPFVGGFVMEDISSELFWEAEGAVYACSITHEQYEQMFSGIMKIEEQKHDYKYNFLGLFAVLFNKEIDRKNAFFCSHFVASILNQSGIELNFNKPLSLVTPEDLSKLASFKLIYHGKLSFFSDNPSQPAQLQHRILQFFRSA